jgi:ABC-type glycerol-3-phosphate transport system substrate-binding protein
VARRSTALLVVLVAIAGCGGGNDKKDANRTVRDFVKATNDRDADKFCEDLVTQQFLEETTGAEGDKAKSACKQQFKALRAVKIRLIQIRKTEIDGDKATVTATIETSPNQPQPRVFRLKKQDGDWRLAGGSGG